jgi:hypothetical protein
MIGYTRMHVKRGHREKVMRVHRLAGIVSAVFFVCLLSSCSAPVEGERVEAQADERIDCATPGKDIETLANEKTRVADESAGGISAVAPSPEIIRIMGSEDALRQMTITEYSEKIDQRMAKIRKICLPNVQCPHWVIRSMC